MLNYPSETYVRLQRESNRRENNTEKNGSDYIHQFGNDNTARVATLLCEKSYKKTDCMSRRSFGYDDTQLAVLRNIRKR